jgi:hypothetical protein
MEHRAPATPGTLEDDRASMTVGPDDSGGHQALVLFAPGRRVGHEGVGALGLAPSEHRLHFGGHRWIARAGMRSGAHKLGKQVGRH